MKKMFIIVLMLAIALSATACSSGNSTDSSSAPSVSTESPDEQSPQSDATVDSTITANDYTDGDIFDLDAYAEALGWSTYTTSPELVSLTEFYFYETELGLAVMNMGYEGVSIWIPYDTESCWNYQINRPRSIAEKNGEIMIRMKMDGVLHPYSELVAEAIQITMSLVTNGDDFTFDPFEGIPRLAAPYSPASPWSLENGVLMGMSVPELQRLSNGFEGRDTE